MKKYIWALGLAVALGASSCSKDFLDTKPTHGLGEEDATGTLKGLQALVEGLHYQMYGYNFGQYWGRGQHSMNVQLDMLSDDMINTRPAVYMATYRWDSHRLRDGALTDNAWTYYYSMILNANKAIEGFRNLSEADKSTADYKHGLANALTIRAHSYFYLVQLYGKRYVPGAANDQLGVIIFEKSTREAKNRSTVGEVYKVIDADLQEAIGLLKDLNIGEKGKQKNTIRYTTACAIAARVALTKGEWAKAVEYADASIKSSGATLQSGNALNDGFNNIGASEWIWGYKQASDQNFFFASFGAGYSYNMNGNGNGSLRYAVNRSLFDKMGPNDARRKWWVCYDLKDPIPSDAYSVYFQGGYEKPEWEVTGQSVKFKTIGPSDSRMDYVLMRLGELYYIKAEAAARNNDEATAKQALKDVMITRDPDYNFTGSGDDLINEILRNKRLDLWMEGRAFLDMKRLGRVPNRLGSGNDNVLRSLGDAFAVPLANFKSRNSGDIVQNVATSVDSKHWEFAIPLSELETNKNITENPL